MNSNPSANPAVASTARPSDIPQRNTPRKLSRNAAAALAAVAAAALSVPLAAVAQESSADTPQALYREALNACTSGASSQPKRTCVYEAQSVRRDARMGKFKTLSTQDWSANALLRCDGVPADARSSCLRLARGEGKSEGSVAEGAIVTWLAESEPAQTVGMAPN